MVTKIAVSLLFLELEARFWTPKKPRKTGARSPFLKNYFFLSIIAKLAVFAPPGKKVASSVWRDEVYVTTSRWVHRIPGGQFST